MTAGIWLPAQKPGPAYRQKGNKNLCTPQSKQRPRLAAAGLIDACKQSSYAFVLYAVPKRYLIPKQWPARPYYIKYSTVFKKSIHFFDESDTEAECRWEDAGKCRILRGGGHAGSRVGRGGLTNINPAAAQAAAG